MGDKTNSGNSDGNVLTYNMVGNSLVYTDTGNNLVSVPPGLNGQVLVQGSGGSVGWTTVTGSGTVTSVGLVMPNFMSVSPSSITTAGTFTVSAASTGTGSVVLNSGGNLSGVVLTDLTANSLVFANASKVLVSVASGTPGQVLTQGSGGSLSWTTVSAGGSGTVTSVGMSVPSFMSVSPSSITTAGTFTISAASTGTGSVVLNSGGSLNGVVLTDLTANSLVFANASKALVSVASGTPGQVLTQGSGGSLSWTTVSGGGGGTVTSVDMTVPSFLSVSGNPVTGSGTLAVNAVAGTSGFVLTSTSGSVGWAAVPSPSWTAPGTIGSVTPNTGTFTQIQGNNMMRSIQAYTTIAYVSGSLTITAAQFATGLIKHTGVAGAMTVTTDTAVNFVSQFGSIVGSVYQGHFIYVSTSGTARAYTWNAGTGVSVYSQNTSNNAYSQAWKIVITSSTTIDFIVGG